jgi:hypothetical protein
MTARTRTMDDANPGSGRWKAGHVPKYCREYYLFRK